MITHNILQSPIQIWVFITGVASTSFNIQLFHGENHTELFYDTNILSSDTPSSSCITLPQLTKRRAASIRTTSCVIIFDNVDCNERFSLKVTPDKGLSLGEHKYKMVAFRPCSEEETSGFGKLAFYSQPNRSGLIGYYEDFCDCIDIPLDIFDKLGSLHNYGNCVQLYKRTGCKGSTIELAGGVSQISEDLRPLMFYYNNFRSARRCERHGPCYRLEAEVFRFEMSVNSRALEMSRTSSSEMTTKSVLKNNGSATITQDYSASKAVTERVEVERGKSVTTLGRFSVGKTVWFDTGSTDFFNVAFLAALSGAFTFEGSKTKRMEEKYVYTEEKRFTISQKIEIPPCTAYQVSSSIKMMENYPMDFTVYSKLTGKSGGGKLLAEELKEIVSMEEDLDYVDEVDDHTVSFKSRGTATAAFALDTTIDGVGFHIDQCVSGMQPKALLEVLKTSKATVAI